MVNEEFDIDDLRYYRDLDAKKKLEYLEQMLLFMQKITPEEAKAKNEQLKKEGF